MQKQKIKKLLDFIPLIVLYISIIITVCTINGDIDLLRWKHYVAFAFLLITTFLFYVKHQVGVLCLCLTLVIGMVGMLSVDAAISTTTFSIGKSSENLVPIFYGQPIFILWLLIHFIVSGRYYVGILTEKYWINLLHNTNQPVNQLTN